MCVLTVLSPLSGEQEMLPGQGPALYALLCTGSQSVVGSGSASVTCCLSPVTTRDCYHRPGSQSSERSAVGSSSVSGGSGVRCEV